MEEKKRKGRKDPELAKIASKLFSLRRRREKELLKKERDEELIEILDEQIENCLKERKRYRKEHGETRGKGKYARTEAANGYYTMTSSQKSDAKIAEELHYPDIVISLLLQEPDEKKRMKILEQARLGSYGKR